MAKKKIRVTVEGYVDWLEDSTVDEVIARLISIKEEWLGKGVSGLFFESNYSNDSDSLDLVGDRDETDAEEKRRLKSEAVVKERAKALKIKNAERRDKSERTTYERLKAKFEGDK